MDDMLNINVTFLPNLRRPSVFEVMPLKRALGHIKNKQYADRIADMRTDLKNGDEKAYKEKKSRLPSYCYQGLFDNEVTNAGFKAASGLFSFDVDKLNSVDQLEETKAVLKADPHVVFFFVSPSGVGLKGAMRVDPAFITGDDKFKVGFSQIERHWAAKGVTIDTSCKDVRRVSYVSHDPDLFFNREAKTFVLQGDTVKKLPTQKPLVAGTEEDSEFAPIGSDDFNTPLPDIDLFNAWEYLPEAGEQSRDQWLQVGAALHHQFSGSVEALDIFDSWSQNVREYQGYDDVAKTWKSFGKRSSGPVVTFRSLVQAHNVVKVKKKLSKDISASEKAQTLLQDCTEYMQLTRSVAPTLWRLANQNVVLESDFIDALRTRYADLRPGKTLSRAEAVRAMKMRHTERQQDAGLSGFENPKTPEWAKGWAWVAAQEVFYNVETGVSLTTVGFRGLFDSNLPQGDNAPVDSARFLRDNNLITKAIDTIYYPGNDKTFIMNGVQYVNSFNSSYRPEVPDTIEDPEAIKAVNLFKKHMDWICGGEREAQLLGNFLACCTLPVPQKVRWAPLIVGAYGAGKSLFYTFVTHALGVKNTKIIPSSLLVSSATTGFSDWAEGHCFGFVDELKVQGIHKHDAINNLKEYLTNSVVPCHKKYKGVETVPNVANYFFCSNYKDAVPIEEGDRRLFVIFSKAAPADIAGNPLKYFNALHDAMQNHTGAIIRWLRDLPIHEHFEPNGHAPTTEAKKAAILISNDDRLEDLVDVLADSTDPEYGDDVVLFDSLFKVVSCGIEGLRIESPKKLASILLKLGFMKIGRLRINGRQESVWARRFDGVDPTCAWAKDVVENKFKALELMGELI